MAKSESKVSVPTPKPVVLGKGASTRGVPAETRISKKSNGGLPEIRTASTKPRADGPVAERDPDLRAAYSLYLTNRNIQMTEAYIRKILEEKGIPFTEKDVAKNRSAIIDSILSQYWGENEDLLK